ncbi:hypothetical protein [Elioraea rosea]|uniref:hypothetical protein n=1 Tax=Elioraea rosea TaxID=2492390 RepID=UPI0013155E4E|nr:hypothetical protein [Elioraea rosea]
MPTEIPWSLVPDRVPAVSEQVMRRAAAMGDERLARAFLWTTAASDAAIARPDLWRAAARPLPDYPFMAAGFARLPKGMVTPIWIGASEGFVFGLCLFPDGQPGESPGLLEPLTVDGAVLPVLRLPARVERHQRAGPTHPSGARIGTAACWAQAVSGGPNPTGMQGSGVLTAAHVAIEATPVTPMTPPSPHAVVGYALDAAVLCPEAIPPHASLLNVLPAAVGVDVDVHLKGARARATVLLAFQPSTHVGFTVPHRLVIDQAYASGDSGALATRAGTRDAVGLYVGTVRPVSGGLAQGVCQAMEQVTAELAIELHL